MRISVISPGIQLWGAAMIFLCLWIAVGKRDLKIRNAIVLLVGNKEYNEQHIQGSWPQHISHHWLFSVWASKQCQLKNHFQKTLTYLSHGINIGLTLFSVRSRENSKLISAKEKLKIPFSFVDPWKRDNPSYHIK